jgi:hypothetical protein
VVLAVLAFNLILMEIIIIGLAAVAVQCMVQVVAVMQD